mgnify:CR=1 FL=1
MKSLTDEEFIKLIKGRRSISVGIRLLKEERDDYDMLLKEKILNTPGLKHTLEINWKSIKKEMLKAVHKVHAAEQYNKK